MVSDYDKCNKWCTHNKRLRALLVEKLAQWLLKSNFIYSKSFVLDYGCGYFDLGFMLVDHVGGVDGYDPCFAGIEYAKSKISDLKNVNLYFKLQDLPKNRYNLIVVNSVLQYFINEKEIANFFCLAKQLLNSSLDSKIIISDIIPMNYPAYLEAVEIFRYAAIRGLGMPVITYLWRSLTGSEEFKLLRINFNTISKYAKQEGFQAVLLENNLTPFKRRYSAYFALKGV